MEVAVVVTYRCVCKCYMCHTWKYPTNPKKEISAEDLEKLPDNLEFVNVTGGEPFVREDLGKILEVLVRKAKRVVISTNGWFTERIIETVRKFPNIGIRVSLEGLPAVNDRLRGMPDGFDHGLRTLLELKEIGFRDIGFGITVSDANAKDMIRLYQLADALKFEFATAVTHNSYYFHKYDNTFENPDLIRECFEDLIWELLQTKRVKNWYRAYFNYGLIRRVYGLPRLLPCEAGTENLFILPYGEVVPCNGSPEPWVMGNIKRQNWNEILNSKEADEVRKMVRNCNKNCWMIGTVAPVMKKYIWKPSKWVAKHVAKVFLGKKPCFKEEIERELEELRLKGTSKRSQDSCICAGSKTCSNGPGAGSGGCGCY